MKKILLINDGCESSNWGLNASSQALIDFCRSSGNLINSINHHDLHKEYAYDPYIFGKKIFASGSRIQKRVSPKYLNIPKTADQYLLYENLWSKNQGGLFSGYILDQVKKSDIVLFNAEGSTYRKNFGALTGLFILYIAAKVHNKKAYFINGSVSISLVDNVLAEIIKKVESMGFKYYNFDFDSKGSNVREVY